MIQSGDSDWIINSHPLGIDSRLRSMAMGLQKMFVLTQKRAFYLAASHRQNELPRRKQRGIKDHNGQNPSPQGAGYSPGRNKI